MQVLPLQCPFTVRSLPFFVKPAQLCHQPLGGKGRVGEAVELLVCQGGRIGRVTDVDADDRNRVLVEFTVVTTAPLPYVAAASVRPRCRLCHVCFHCLRGQDTAFLCGLSSGRSQGLARRAQAIGAGGEGGGVPGGDEDHAAFRTDDTMQPCPLCLADAARPQVTKGSAARPQVTKGVLELTTDSTMSKRQQVEALTALIVQMWTSKAPCGGETLPLPCVSTTCAAKTAPLPCVSTAFAA